MVEYTLAGHARTVLSERQIEQGWPELALAEAAAVEPDPTDAELEHRLRRIAECGKRVLRVIVNTAVEPVRVVTVYFDRRAKDKP